ncbi:S-layer homology domain-containing protein [Paenibacillus sp. CN-4]|uniref:S-layer homology domain-containing protein n=1 Tax=Paenibacillus nanchangensis TaxID=3348343 RepID=UPI0039789BC1
MDCKSFADVRAGHWARQAVEVLAAKGVIYGLSDTAYAPDTHVSRADYVLILARAWSARG